VCGMQCLCSVHGVEREQEIMCTNCGTHHHGGSAARVPTRQPACLLRNMEALSRKHRCSRKAKSIAYSECVCVALVIHHVKRMRSVVLSRVVCLVVIFIFSHYLIHGTIFGEEKLLNIKCVMIFCTNFV
jgi:hypothetical protein